MGYYEGFRVFKRKKPSVTFELLEGVGRVQKQRRGDLLATSISWGRRQRQKSPFSVAHNGSLLRCTKPSSFILKGPADLPSFRPGLFCFPPQRFTVVDISKVFIVGPTVNRFQSCVHPWEWTGLGWGESAAGRVLVHGLTCPKLITEPTLTPPPSPAPDCWA